MEVKKWGAVDIQFWLFFDRAFSHRMVIFNLWLFFDRSVKKWGAAVEVVF
jgi:hypothetical protein